MKNKIVAVIIGISFLSILVLLFNSDERIIKRKLGQLVGIAAKEKDDSNFIFISKVKKLKSLFTYNCTLIFENELFPEIKNVDELLVVYNDLYNYVEEVEIELSDISIVIFNDSKAALTKVKGNSIVKPRQNEKSLIIEQDLEISWLKMNGKWQVFVINGINLWE